MNYLKLFIPIALAILVAVLSENYFIEHTEMVAIILKAGMLIYYLRLGSTGTPLINTLTIILVIMAIGEYLLQTSMSIGQIILVISDLALGLIYVIRQKLKGGKDKLSKLKITAVFIFVLTNPLSADRSMNLFPLSIATLILAFVYFYDRLTAIADLKNVARRT